MRVLVGVMLLTVLLALPFLAPVQQYLSIPKEIVTVNNQEKLAIPTFSDPVNLASNEQRMLTMDSGNFYAEAPGESELIYEFAGIPVKKVDLTVLDDITVIPGGQSLGVQLHTLGVLVVGHHLVNNGGETQSPGEDAKVKVGDIILKIDGAPIYNMEDVKPFVEKAGNGDTALNLTIKRGKETIETKLKPIMDKKENSPQIGLYIRDSAAGIGTMTFFEPKSKKYGALGHVISDMDTKKPIEIHDGKIVRSSVTAIEKGNSGTPGEKQAKFSVADDKIGTITKNSPFGIFGKLNEPITNGRDDTPLSVALSHEVKEGPAKILTVVKGEKVEEYDIEIVSTIPQKFPATKGMVIKVTDPELLKQTGGIVQGMSGSPIIQGDKIIGAVTHVFVNDPTSGYGVHIEWMLEEAGVDIYKKEQAAS